MSSERWGDQPETTDGRARARDGNQVAQGERRRAHAIRRFVLKQQRRRQFIGFAEIAEHMTKSASIPLAAAFAKLLDATLLGTFEQYVRPAVLHVTPHYVATADGPRPAHRYLSAALLTDAIEVYGGNTTPSAPLVLDFLAPSWLPAAAARRWLERSGYGWPPHFEPDPEISAQAPSMRRPGPRTTKTDDVKDAMRALCRNGGDLRGMKEEAMRVRFGAARSTCRKARRAV